MKKTYTWSLQAIRLFYHLALILACTRHVNCSFILQYMNLILNVSCFVLVYRKKIMIGFLLSSNLQGISSLWLLALLTRSCNGYNWLYRILRNGLKLVLGIQLFSVVCCRHVFARSLKLVWLRVTNMILMSVWFLKILKIYEKGQAMLGIWRVVSWNKLMFINIK
jgi:hypothetical protein